MNASSTIFLLSRLFSRIAPYSAVLFLLVIVDIFVAGHLASEGLTRRFLKLAPLWIALGSGVVVVAGLAGSYYMATLQERRLACRDIVPVAKMARTRQGWEIHFALGRSHGIRPQDTLLLLDARFAPVGRIVVDRVEENHSTSLVPLDATIAPDYWLAKAQD
jgi:hypothetical protein